MYNVALNALRVIKKEKTREPERGPVTLPVIKEGKGKPDKM